MRLYVPATTIDGLGNVIKSWLTALAVDPTATIEPSPGFSLGEYQTVLHPRHIYSGDGRVPLYTCRLRVLASEHDGQRHLPTESTDYALGNPMLDSQYSPHLIDWNYDLAALSPVVVDRVHRTLAGVTLLPEITRRCAEQVVDGRSLGVAVRTWRAPHEPDGINRPYCRDSYRHAIQQEIDCVDTVVLCADRQDTLEEYLEWLSLFPVNVVVPARVAVDNATQGAFAQLAALAACNVLVGARLSTFTELAWWFGRNRARVVPLF
jgi:hypothetical protein